jgi:hypothetical protein
VAIEIENMKNTSGCIISMEWRPPLGYSEADVDHYIVDIPSGKSRVTLESSVAFFLHIHECNENMSVKLRAVNRCTWPYRFFIPGHKANTIESAKDYG